MIFTCQVCAIAFTSKSIFETHMLSKHHKCKDCKVTFTSKNKYQMHLAVCRNADMKLSLQKENQTRVDSKEDFKLFRCDFCNTEFQTLSDLRKHQKEEHNNARYHCAMCDFKCFRK